MSKLTLLKNAVTSRAGRQLLKVQKHSPAILFAAGTVGVVGTVVLACRATLKLEEVLVETQKDMATVQAVVHDSYSEEDRQKDLLLLRVKGAVSIGKLYAPSIILGVVSVAALTGSHVILNRRNVGLTAAYAALDKGFREYRQRVVDKYGSDTDRDLRYGVTKKKIVEETETGPVTKTVKTADMDTDPSIYARFFDESCRSFSKEPMYNQLFIQSQQNYANDLLRSRGHVFLNEVYDSLGIPRSKQGQVVGWVLGNGGDDYIDFGVFRGADTFMGQQFVNGEEKAVLLDFNVDGIIYDLI